MLKEWEDRHPWIRSVIADLTPAHLTEADKVATRFEDLAKHVASLLPDGQALELGIELLQRAQRHIMAALVPVDETPEPAAVGTPDGAGSAAPVGRAGVDYPITGPVSDGSDAPMPGRDHPIDWTPPAPDEPAVEPPAVTVPEDLPPADESTVDGSAASSTDSGPAGTSVAPADPVALIPEQSAPVPVGEVADPGAYSIADLMVDPATGAIVPRSTLAAPVFSAAE